MDAEPIGGYTKVKITTGGLYKIDMDRRGDSIIETIKESFSFLPPAFLIGAFAQAIQSFPVAALRELIQPHWMENYIIFLTFCTMQLTDS